MIAFGHLLKSVFMVELVLIVTRSSYWKVVGMGMI